MSSTPAGWIEVALSEILIIQRGFAFKAEDYIPLDTNSVVCYRVTNIGERDFSENDKTYLPGCFFNQYKEYQLYTGDVLLVMVGATTGKIGFVPKTNRKILLNQNAWKLSPKLDNLSQMFLKQSSRLWVENHLMKMQGSAREFLKSSDFLKEVVILPPLNEQKKIGEILTSVDKVIELTEIEIEKLKNLKKGMMQDLLTKGIGHTKFKDSPIGRIPESWDVVKNKEVTTLITKGTTPTSVGYNFEDKGINFIKVESIVEDGVIDSKKFAYISKECDETLRRSRLLENDVVMTIAGATVGKLAVIEKQHVPANTNQALGIMRPDSKKINFMFLYYFLMSDFIKQEIGIIQTAGAQPNLSLAQLSNYDILLPPLEEQRMIVSILNSNDRLLKIKNKKLIDLQNLKKGLMQDLLTGKVRVKI